MPKEILEKIKAQQMTFFLSPIQYQVILPAGKTSIINNGNSNSSRLIVQPSSKPSTNAPTSPSPKVFTVHAGKCSGWQTLWLWKSTKCVQFFIILNVCQNKTKINFFQWPINTPFHFQNKLPLHLYILFLKGLLFDGYWRFVRNVLRYKNGCKMNVIFIH